MLLVVFILGMVATSMVIFLDERGHQARYDDTKRRYEQIRDGIFGPENITVNGSPMLKGYLADTGELPTELRHLWVCPEKWRIDGDPAKEPKPYESVGGAESKIQIFHGWRGPYVSFVSASADAADDPEADDDFRDGWGNKWFFNKYLDPLGPGGPKPLIRLQSRGRNGEPEASVVEGPDADFPKAAEIDQNVFTANAAIPQIRIKDLPGSGGPFYLGVVYAGFDKAALWPSTTPIDHVSLVKVGGGSGHVLKLSDDLIDPDGGGPEPKETLPSNLVFARIATAALPLFPRQFQLVIYDASKPGTTFADKMKAVYPVVFTLPPKTTFVAPATPMWDVPATSLP